MFMKKNTKIIILVGVILLVIVSVVGVTYAFLSTGGTQEQANTFNSGCLSIRLTNESTSINLTNTFPITDIEGLNTTSYDFTIENTCSTATNYQINLESLNPVSNTLDADYIKVSLSSDTVGNVISTLSDNNTTTSYIDGSYISHNLYTGSIAGNTTKTYHLRLWIDYDATVAQAANKTYESKINVIANPDIEVVDTMEATFELNDKTLTTNLTSNVISATYCTSTDNICEPNTSASISGNSYSVDLSGTQTTKQVATALGNITVNTSSSQMVCTRLNGTSKVICSNSEEVELVNFNNTSCSVGSNMCWNSSTSSYVSCDCGEETVGIYEETTSKGTTYYWRGDVENNYLVFANKYWRIIRINEDGSIRVIYSGEKAEVDAAGKETVLANGYNDDNTRYTQTGMSSFNYSRNVSEYIGYRYTSGSQRPSSTSEGTDSRIKTYLETWYSNNLQSYDDQIVSSASAGFCNDRELQSGSGSWVSTGNTQYYAAYERVYTTRQPTYECSNSNDLYQTKIGLITADEVMYTGGSGSNRGYYLYTGNAYWTMSPSYFSATSRSAKTFFVSSDGNPNSNGTVDSSNGVRPVINISPNVTITGSGTIQDPYVAV